MRLLLDTHALIWWLTSDPHLSAAASTAIASPANTLFVSAASAYEIAYKSQRGRLSPLPLSWPVILRRAQLNPVDISLDHAEAAGQLPGPHRDPWDRLLIAQAQRENLIVLTVDPVFTRYGISTLW